MKKNLKNLSGKEGGRALFSRAPASFTIKNLTNKSRTSINSQVGKGAGRRNAARPRRVTIIQPLKNQLILCIPQLAEYGEFARDLKDEPLDVDHDWWWAEDGEKLSAAMTELGWHSFDMRDE